MYYKSNKSATEIEGKVTGNGQTYTVNIDIEHPIKSEKLDTRDARIKMILQYLLLFAVGIVFLRVDFTFTSGFISPSIGENFINRLLYELFPKLDRDTGKYCGNNRSFPCAHQRAVEENQRQHNRKGNPRHIEGNFYI